jgi:hypothetical protein
VCYTNETRILEVPDNLILGNHKALKGIEEISINYTSSVKVYDRSTTTANLCFSTVIIVNFLNYPNPKTMAECKKHWTGTSGKKQLKLSLTRLRKERYS